MTEIRHLNDASIEQWAATAMPGSRVIYHTGKVAQGWTCRRAMDLCVAGVVTLVQKRADLPHEFHYIAVKLRGKSK